MNATDECVRLGLRPEPIESSESVWLLRWLRNLTKDGFSFDNHEITEEEQRAWWAAMRGRVRGWLYFLDSTLVLQLARDTGQTLMPICGFGVLRQTDDGRWWSSVGVHPSNMGHGFGGAITADLVRRHDGPVYATARRDNTAAQKLHRAADWDEVESGEPDRLIAYVTKPHVYLPPEAEAWRREGWAVT